MLDLGKQLTLCHTIASQLVGDDHPWHVLHTFQQPFEEALRMALDGRITEVCSVAALLRVALTRNGGHPDGLVER